MNLSSSASTLFPRLRRARRSIAVGWYRIGEQAQFYAKTIPAASLDSALGMYLWGWAIFTGLSFLPITAMPFFKTGPLAWNGAITFWALFGTYFIWTGSMGVCMAKDASRRLREETELHAPRQLKEAVARSR